MNVYSKIDLLFISKKYSELSFINKNTSIFDLEKHLSDNINTFTFMEWKRRSDLQINLRWESLLLPGVRKETKLFIVGKGKRNTIRKDIFYFNIIINILST